MLITTTVTLTPDQICNLFVSAFEGGSNYWLQQADLTVGKERKKPGLVWWGEPKVFAEPFTFKVKYDDPKKDEGNGKGRKTLTQDDVQKGLQLMAVKSPDHFADILQENEDANTADVFMQYVILGEIVYG